MDPFIQINYGKLKLKTKVLDEAGKKPIWNEDFEIKIEDLEDEITLTCYDEDVAVNDLVGDVKI